MSGCSTAAERRRDYVYCKTALDSQHADAFGVGGGELRGGAFASARRQPRGPEAGRRGASAPADAPAGGGGAASEPQ